MLVLILKEVNLLREDLREGQSSIIIEHTHTVEGSLFFSTVDNHPHNTYIVVSNISKCMYTNLATVDNSQQGTTVLHRTTQK